MSEKPSDDDKIPPDSEPKDIIWWSSETNRTVEGYLKQRDNIQREIDNIKKDYGITTEIMIKVHIPKEYLKKDKNGNTYISAKKRIDTFKSCPYGMIISTELTDFTVNLVEHNYTINQKEIQEDKMA
ncbi:MAG: hypothetical protein KAJ54_03025, partial [Candidatus Aenigmarchaeota archaeon]|nr:hypothetical protein [Candidatus Aenigmarchaeota archaeon]